MNNNQKKKKRQNHQAQHPSFHPFRGTIARLAFATARGHCRHGSRHGVLSRPAFRAAKWHDRTCHVSAMVQPGHDMNPDFQLLPKHGGFSWVKVMFVMSRPVFRNCGSKTMLDFFETLPTEFAGSPSNYSHQIAPS